MIYLKTSSAIKFISREIIIFLIIFSNPLNFKLNELLLSFITKCIYNKKEKKLLNNGDFFFVIQLAFVHIQIQISSDIVIIIK